MPSWIWPNLPRVAASIVLLRHETTDFPARRIREIVWDEVGFFLYIHFFFAICTPFAFHYWFSFDNQENVGRRNEEDSVVMEEFRRFFFFQVRVKLENIIFGWIFFIYTRLAICTPYHYWCSTIRRMLDGGTGKILWRRIYISSMLNSGSLRTNFSNTSEFLNDLYSVSYQCLTIN